MTARPDQLPEVWRKVGTNGNVVHRDPDCDFAHIHPDRQLREVDFEYARRAGWRWCNGCGNGKMLAETVEGSL